MPDDRAALAASDGLVVFAANTPRGWSVKIDHAPRKLTTYYTHLSSLTVSKDQYIAAGTPIGIIGGDPLDAAHLSSPDGRPTVPPDRDPPEVAATRWWPVAVDVAPLVAGALAAPGWSAQASSPLTEEYIC
jgi:hypothetical protein